LTSLIYKTQSQVSRLETETETETEARENLRHRSPVSLPLFPATKLTNEQRKSKPSHKNPNQKPTESGVHSKKKVAFELAEEIPVSEGRKMLSNKA